MPLPLVTLVRKVLHDSGLSVASFAEAKGMPYATVRRYTDVNLKPLKSAPRQETLRQLALALDLPLSEVQRAAVDSVAYVYSVSTGDGTATAHSFDLLSEEEKVAWVQEIYPMIKEYLP
jgi:transcriptional regulator with XRE-family HTH domain